MRPIRLKTEKKKMEITEPTFLKTEQLFFKNKTIIFFSKNRQQVYKKIHF